MVNIRDDQKKWLDEHREVNFSGQVQVWIDKLIQKRKEGGDE